LTGTEPRTELRPDCGSCFALCCVALPFAASNDFAIGKEAGRPCQNLRADHRCGIHSRLRESGFAGCTVFDCYGAGQRVSQQTFGGTDWRGNPGTARAMFGAFPVVRQLHELLRYLTEALGMPAARPLREDLRAALTRTDELAGGSVEALAALDVEAHWADANALLLRASELARAGAKGRKLRGADLRGANLRGAYLIAATLTGADLRRADVIGADLRDADLRGADLTSALFLTQAQLDAARGDSTTKLPAALRPPPHWAP
jgi:uncharacterized protein YjbI with pentapeptide repeats